MIDDGFECLRRAVRIAPRDFDIRIELADRLVDHWKYDEALEHYWRCFEAAKLFEDRLSVALTMAGISTDSGGVETLIEEFRRRGQSTDDPKETSLFIVEILSKAGDDTGARAFAERYNSKCMMFWVASELVRAYLESLKTCKTL